MVFLQSRFPGDDSHRSACEMLAPGLPIAPFQVPQPYRTKAGDSQGGEIRPMCPSRMHTEPGLWGQVYIRWCAQFPEQMCTACELGTSLGPGTLAATTQNPILEETWRNMAEAGWMGPHPGASSCNYSLKANLAHEASFHHIFFYVFQDGNTTEGFPTLLTS